MFAIDYKDHGTPASDSKTAVTLEIDGRSVTVPEGTSIMRAAMYADVQVPKLCATDTLKAFGSCRLCLVEIEGRKGYPASCTTTVAAGMKIRRRSAKLAAAAPRRHRSVCLRSPARLRHLPREWALRTAGHGGAMRASPRPPTADRREAPPGAKDASNPYFTFDPKLCIVCSRCVRACDEQQGTLRAHHPGARLRLQGVRQPGRAVPRVRVRLLRRLRRGLPDRGAHREIRHRARASPSMLAKTTCAYCGVGCSFKAETRGAGARRRGRAHGTRPHGRRQSRPRLRQGTLRLRLRDARGSHHEAHDPREHHRSLARSVLGGGHRPRRERDSSASRPSTAGIRSAASPLRAAPTRKPSSCRSWCAPPSATTTSTPARACAIRRRAMA